MVTVLALVLAACSSASSADSSPTPSPSRAVPQEIISLSPTATEMLFAIGAGSQVIAVDEFSDYPAEAPTTKLSGFDPNLEAIATYGPDLVVIASDPGGVVKGLGKLNVPVLSEPTAETLDDSYAQLAELGTVTGHADEAASVIDAMKTQIDQIVAAAPDGAGLSVYHELDDTYYSATSDTFIGQIYGLFGVANIADEAKGASSGYPQLSSEYIVGSDPSLIVLADGTCCGQTPAKVMARPGWGGITAVNDGSVIVIDDSIASRWGPRVVELVQQVAEGLKGASA